MFFIKIVTLLSCDVKEKNCSDSLSLCEIEVENLDDPGKNPNGNKIRCNVTN